MAVSLAIALLLSSPGLLVRARITKPLKLHVLHFNDVHNRIKAATTSYVGHPPLLLPPYSSQMAPPCFTGDLQLKVTD